MGNLGWYQIMTTVAKKVGGPKNLILLIGGVGAAIGSATTLGGKAIKKKFNNYLAEKRKVAKAAIVYTVSCDSKSNEGLIFTKDDQFRVIDLDGDAALVEIIGNDHNPYFVSAKYLATISNYSNQS